MRRRMMMQSGGGLPKEAEYYTITHTISVPLDSFTMPFEIKNMNGVTMEFMQLYKRYDWAGCFNITANIRIFSFAQARKTSTNYVYQYGSGQGEYGGFTTNVWHKVENCGQGNHTFDGVRRTGSSNAQDRRNCFFNLYANIDYVKQITIDFSSQYDPSGKVIHLTPRYKPNGDIGLYLDEKGIWADEVYAS